MASPADIRENFRQLHSAGLFVMPNPWDLGSAKLLTSFGFRALATTSSGHAASLGKQDQHVTRDELVEHVATMSRAVEVPINVDAERCFADDAAGIATTIDLLAAAGAAGISIEDYDPATQAVETIEVATERVGAAAEAAHRHGVTLTALAEKYLYGQRQLDDIVDRLCAYRDAGADCLYAPGLTDLGEIEHVVQRVGKPINVLAMPTGPTVAELESVGVRRVSTGGALAWAAYGAMARGARELLDAGTSTYTRDALSRADRAAFD